jgi:EpsI family protein
MNRLRFWTVVGLLSATALLLAGRSRSEPTPSREPLSQIPNRIPGWLGTDQSIDAETLEVLGSGEFLSRVYVGHENVLPISLFVAYFPTQRTGATIHSPKHCLPGAGWVFESSQYVQLKDAVGNPHQVGEYTIGNGAAKEFVIYWYEAHGRSVAGEYFAKYYLIADAIRMNRSDGALVRVITPIGTGEDTVNAKTRAESFVAQLAPMLPRFIPN